MKKKIGSLLIVFYIIFFGIMVNLNSVNYITINKEFLKSSSYAYTELWEFVPSPNTRVTKVVISSDGNYIAAGDEDWTYSGNVYLFNKLSSIPLWNHSIGGSVQSLAISSNGDYITATTDTNTIFMFTRLSHIPIWKFKTDYYLGNVDISANGNYIVVGGGYPGGNGTINVFQKSNGIPLWNFTSQQYINSVAISSDGQYVAAGSADYKIFLFNISGDSLWNCTPSGLVSNIKISQDGTYIAAGGGSMGSGTLQLFHRNSSIPLWNTTMTESIASIAMSSNGDYIATGHNNYHYGQAYLFNKSSSSYIWYYREPLADAVYEVSITSDGSYVASACYQNARFFDNTTSNPIWNFNLKYGGVRSICLSSDGDYVVAGGGRYFTNASGTFKEGSVKLIYNNISQFESDEVDEPLLLVSGYNFLFLFGTIGIISTVIVIKIRFKDI